MAVGISLDKPGQPADNNVALPSIYFHSRARAPRFRANRNCPWLPSSAPAPSGRSLLSPNATTLTRSSLRHRGSTRRIC